MENSVLSIILLLLIIKVIRALMEGTTDPSVLEHRLYYKIGSFVYDNAKVVLVATLLLGCLLYTSPSPRDS